MAIPLGVTSDSNWVRYSFFEKVFLETLNDHAPLKQKTIRVNYALYMSKTLRKAMIHRSQLETKYRKQPTDINSERYRQQKIFCSKLFKQERRIYYSNLDLKQFTGSKTFWQNMNLFLETKIRSPKKLHWWVTIKFFPMILKLPKNLTSFLKRQLIIWIYLLMKIWCFPLRIYLIQFR